MKRFLLAFALLLAASASATAQINTGPKVQARLVAEQGEIAPGKSITVALEEVIKPGWHTYWSNPGEAGLPSEIKWTLPSGWKASAIVWPYPKRLPVGPLMNYGYENNVWLLTTITASSDAKPGDIVNLKAAADWLVCKEICIPEDTKLSLPLTVSANPSAPYATVKEQFDAARAKIPMASPWPVTFQAGDNLDLFIASPSLAKSQLKEAVFFPAREGIVDGMAAQQRGTTNDGLVLRVAKAKNGKTPKVLPGVLVLTSADGTVQALSVNAKLGVVPGADFGSTEDSGLLVALLFALVGGLILNLMPCVLPILAMKALAIAGQAHGDKREARREGFAYGIGAILTFAAIGLLLVLLRAGGQAIGWGFQLQEPAAVAFFALLVFAVGLNLSGVFEVGNVTAGDTLTRRGGWIGSFFTGVLAVAVAAPCTAPFMAAALGYALTQSAVTALLIFIALGIGFALPFVLIGLVPALLRVLPKPGAWMLTFKQLLAFPMYGAAAWLLWVLSQETAGTGLVAAFAGFIALAFAAWVWDASRNASSGWRGAGMIFALLGLLGTAASLVFIHDTAAPPIAAAAQAEVAGIPAESYSTSKLASLRAQKRPVFVDATASWCITCLVNEKVALSGDAVHQAFASKHIAYLVADWTNRNPQITALLAAHGRSGVPLYLYYAPGAADAVILPQVLTESTVLNTIGAK
jgi:thiol:disulfide interchange protein DsbD